MGAVGGRAGGQAALGAAAGVADAAGIAGVAAPAALAVCAAAVAGRLLLRHLPRQASRGMESDTGP